MTKRDHGSPFVPPRIMCCHTPQSSLEHGPVRPLIASGSFVFKLSTSNLDQEAVEDVEESVFLRLWRSDGLICCVPLCSLACCCLLVPLYGRFPPSGSNAAPSLSRADREPGEDVRSVNEDPSFISCGRPWNCLGMFGSAHQKYCIDPTCIWLGSNN